MRLSHNLGTCQRISRWQGASSPRLGITTLRMLPQRPSHVHCSLGASVGPRLRRGRSVCLARVGPHLKSEAHSICRHLAMIPHGMPVMPSCLSARLNNMPTVRRRPTTAHLSQRTPMDGLNPIAHHMSWITRS
ncbi:UNVERIFIED_CONTAM: hypothetical protein Slati_2899700 [Sesamum latifolium]|uniref:Uncharacterized protein n=1 Tax=Sesamum latifolium TaxID=2727402 RepID=A0AAW2VCJ0_9LAMI